MRLKIERVQKKGRQGFLPALFVFSKSNYCIRGILGIRLRQVRHLPDLAASFRAEQIQPKSLWAAGLVSLGRNLDHPVVVDAGSLRAVDFDPNARLVGGLGCLLFFRRKRRHLFLAQNPGARKKERKAAYISSIHGLSSFAAIEGFAMIFCI
jgi:hypothetical protein